MFPKGSPLLPRYRREYRRFPSTAGAPFGGLFLTALIAISAPERGPKRTRPKIPALTLRCDLSAWDCGEADLADPLAKHCAQANLASTRSLRFGESLSLVYRVDLRPQETMAALVRDLSQIEGVERVVILAGNEEIASGDVE